MAKANVTVFLKDQEPESYECQDVDNSPVALILTLSEDESKGVVFPMNDNLLKYIVEEIDDAESD